MAQQQGQVIPQQQQMRMPQQPQQGTSPLLAQQLSGQQQQQPQQQQPQPQQQQQQQQQQPQQNEEELGAGLEQNDLQDLGVPDEDLLGMAEDFNILEFADALDESDSNKTNILDELQAEDEAVAADAANSEKLKEDEGANKPPPPPYTANTTNPQQQQQQQQQQGQQAGTSRGPPPPYPGGQQGQPNPQNKVISSLFPFNISLRL